MIYSFRNYISLFYFNGKIRHINIKRLINIKWGDFMVQEKNKNNSIDDKITYKKKSKSKLIFTYYNPNTPEKTKEMIKNIIVKTLINKKENKYLNL